MDLLLGRGGLGAAGVGVVVGRGFDGEERGS